MYSCNEGEEPNGQPDQTLLGEEVGNKLGYTVGPGLRRDDVSSPINSNGATVYALAEQHGHVASVIQRSGPSPPSSSYASNGSGSRHAAAFYSYQQTSSRSPSPARGGAHCNGVVAATMAGQRATGTAASPLHSNVSNGSSAASSQRSYQSSPKMQDAEPLYSQPAQLHQQPAQQQLHGVLYNNNNNSLASSSNHHSSSSSTSSSTHPSYPRVDDLASRSHRLEEALLRASRKSPPVPPAPLAAASSSSSSSSSSAAAHFNPGSSGRTSADELLELKKRSGYGSHFFS